MTDTPDPSVTTPFRRVIKSYVLRAGRTGPGQQRAYEQFGPRFLLPYRPEPLDPVFRALLIANGAMLLWRLAIRAGCTGWHYGWRQALWSVPRMFVGNIIAMMAARRALVAYASSLGLGPFVPELPPFALAPTWARRQRLA